MMATTHALVGIAIAAAATFVAPDLSLVAVGAAAAGGVFPDLDLYAGHRKTLHFPVYYSVMAVSAVVMVAVSPSQIMWGLALFLVSAAIHSLMDALGGGLELRPWQGTSQRAVYSHYHERWIRPRRWIRYDGAPEDLGLAIVASLPALSVFEGTIATGIVALLSISAVYVLLRKPIVWMAEWLYAHIPGPVRVRLPRRFVEDLS
jgi:hypothetical protein